MQRTLRRKLLSVFLILAMLISLMTGLAVNVSAEEADETEPTGVVTAKDSVESEDDDADNPSDTEDDQEALFVRDPDEYPEADARNSGPLRTLSLPGSGTAADPYQVGSQSDLAQINSELTACFILTANITLDSSWPGIGTSNIGSASTNSPIEQTGANGFTGTLDGDGYTITVSRTVTASGMGGVVNYLAPGGVVKNLTVSGSVTATGNRDAIGGVVGYNSGKIHNVTSNVTVIASNSYNVGGIAGFNNGIYGTSPIGKIYYCHNNGSVSAYGKVGGIAGENAGSIAACWNTATISSNNNYMRSGNGGIVGRNGNNGSAYETGVIRNCYNTGTISGYSAGSSAWLGALVGFQNSYSSTINCYNTGTAATNRLYGQYEGSGWSYNYSGAQTATTMESHAHSASTLDSTVAVWTLNSSPATLTLNSTGIGIEDVPVYTGDVYLDGTAATNGDGTPTNPYNNLSSALADASATRDIVILGTVTVSSATTINAAITIRGNASMAYGTLFSVVSGGSLTLSNGVVIEDCGIAVDVLAGGSLTVNAANITGTTYSIKNAGIVTLNGTGIVVTGNVYLASGVSITAAAAIPCDLTVDCASPSDGTVLVTGSGYTLTATDTTHVSCTASAYLVVLDSLNNEIELSAIPAGVYLDGGASTGGAGTYASPYNDLATAIANAGSGNLIYVIGTTDLSSGTYGGSSGVVTIKRFASFSGIMFTVNSGASVTLQNMTIDGNAASGAVGTNLIRVYGGALTLSSTVTLQNAVSTASGAALHVQGGAVTSQATFQNCEAWNGGAVAVTSSSSTNLGAFTMTGGSITGCTANNNGGGVYTGSAGTLYLQGGSITGNVAVNGGGVYVGGYKFNVESGMISGNSATYGEGIYIYPGSMVFLRDGVVDSSQAIYLANTAASSDAVLSLQAPLTNIVTVTCANPYYGQVIVNVDGNYTLTNADAANVVVSGSFRTAKDMSVNQLILAVNETYLDGTASTNGNGTPADPFNSLADAVAAATNSASTIYICGTVTISANTTLNNDFKREGSFTGDMFVVTGGTVTISGGSIYGAAGSAPTGSLIKISGGAVVMNGGTLTDNYAVNGGAVYLASGTFTMTGGTISGNTAGSNGAGVYVTAGTTFNLGCSGIASTDTVYLANTTDTDCYIILTTALTSELTVANADTSVSPRVARTSNTTNRDAALANITHTSGLTLISTHILSYYWVKLP